MSLVLILKYGLMKLSPSFLITLYFGNCIYSHPCRLHTQQWSNNCTQRLPKYCIVDNNKTNNLSTYIYKFVHKYVSKISTCGNNIFFLKDLDFNIFEINTDSKLLRNAEIIAVTYEGWNFNSGNYLFTNDAK